MQWALVSMHMKAKRVTHLRRGPDTPETLPLLLPPPCRPLRLTARQWQSIGISRLAYVPLMGRACWLIL